MKLSEFTAARKIILNGRIDNELLNKFDSSLADILKEGMPDHLIIAMTTTGGMLALGHGLSERIRLLQSATNVSFVGIGCIFSYGIRLMLDFKPEHRFATKNTRFLIHSPQREEHLHLQNTVESSVLRLEEIRQDMKEAQRWHRQLIRDLRKASGIDEGELFRRSRQSWYFGTRQAKKLGLIHDLLK